MSNKLLIKIIFININILIPITGPKYLVNIKLIAGHLGTKKETKINNINELTIMGTTSHFLFLMENVETKISFIK